MRSQSILFFVVIGVTSDALQLISGAHLVGCRGGQNSNRITSRSRHNERNAAGPYTQRSALTLRAGGSSADGKALAPIASPPRQISATASVVGLVKCIVGAGMLALPAGMAAGKGTGYLPALALVILNGALSAYAFTLIGRATRVTGAGDFRELWSRSVGPDSSWIVDGLIFGTSIASLLVQQIFFADTFRSLVGGGILSRTQSLLVSSLLFAPMVILPDLSALAPAALAGFAAVIYTAGFILKRCLDGTYAVAAASAGKVGRFAQAGVLEMLPEVGQCSFGRLSAGSFVLFNMLSTSFYCHGSAVRFYNELEDGSPKKFAMVSSMAFGVSAMIYAIAAVAGYATFGSASTAPVLNNYAASDVLATLTRAATGVSLFGGYALMFVAMRDAFLSSIVPSADDTDTKRGPFSSVQVVSSTAWRMASLALLSFTTLLGVVTTDAGFAASLSGSSLGAALIFCVPSRIFLSCVAKAKASGDSLASNLEVSLVRAFFRFGLVAITLGTTITVLETFTSILA